MISAFIRDPEFVGQTKDRLATTEVAHKLVEGAVRDRTSIPGWRADPKTAGAILDYLDRSGPRSASAAASRKGNRSANRRPRSCASPESWPTALAPDAGTAPRSFMVEGDSAGGSAKAGSQPGETQAAAAPARQDPQRARRGLFESSARMPGIDQGSDARRSASRHGHQATATTICATRRSSS